MNPYAEQTGWQEFLSLCLKAGSIERLNEVLSLHLTAEERQAVATRYLIIRELIKGERTQRDMAKTLDVSIAKITRGSNSLKIIEPQLRDFIQQQIEQD